MKIFNSLKINVQFVRIAVLFLFVVSGAQLFALTTETYDTFDEYKGVVVDKATGNPLAFTNVVLMGTNISTVSNTEGEFSIKVASSLKNGKISVRYIGYKNRIVSLTDLTGPKNRIDLEPVSVELPRNKRDIEGRKITRGSHDGKKVAELFH